MKKYQFILLSIIFLQGHTIAWSQSKNEIPLAAIGDKCPDYTFNTVHHYRKSTLSTRDFENKKWLILDFWSRTCIVCGRSFPKLSELQEKFKNDIQFVLVGHNDKEYNSDIKEVYENHRQIFNLNLSIAYDSVYRNKFPVRSIPHIVIIDKKGFIYTYTSPEQLTEEKLTDLVKGRKPQFVVKND